MMIPEIILARVRISVIVISVVGALLATAGGGPMDASPFAPKNRRVGRGGKVPLLP